MLQSANFNATMALAKLLLSVCLLIIAIAVDARTDAEGALNDVRALREFKRLITSDPISILKEWDDDEATAAPTTNACNWTGISCSSKNHPGRVTHISLDSARLRGSLSPQVANLSFLEVLDISNNSLSGKIPHFIGTLQMLRNLNLSLNEFEGFIPPQIGNLSSLQFLGLRMNSLTGEIPGSLAKLKELSLFDVYRNQLGGQIPAWLGALQKLDLLDLGENKIHGVIPPELGNLSSLHLLGLGSNRFKGSIPCSIARLYRLAHLFLEENNFIGSLPACLSNLTALTKLHLFSNKLQGNLPNSIGSFHKLECLVMCSNKFTGGLPQSWRNLTQLQIMDLSHNRLAGTPPSWLGRLCSHQLQHLHLGQNNFTSGVSSSSQPIPFLEAISNCSEITGLLLFGNILTGTLPTRIGSFWPNLQYLDLSSNFISGNIPASIGNLSSLYSLKLSDNLFRGTIPAQIANLKSVQEVAIDSNKLHGNIPTEISLLNKTLGYLFLSENALSGSIPANIRELVNLRWLHLGKNMLSGKIPSEIGQCPVLESLVLSENNLSGAIPPEVAGLKTIIFRFDLSRNSLSGKVPPEIGGLQMAQFINLSSNRFSGNIALYLDSWLDARHINLSFNNFSGNLSSSIGNQMTQLESMDLSHNNFTGPLPASLFNLSNLHFLNFSCNRFEEEVPCLNGFFHNLRLSRASFLENPKLCGRCFGLRACARSAEHHKDHNNKNTILRIVLCILGGLLTLVTTGVLFLHRRRIERPDDETPRLSEIFLKMSVQELHTATNNLSPLNLVGEGIHGKVYRGFLGSGLVVAIKCFSCTNDYNGTEKSFKKECRALAKVRHRNILKIITVVWSDELKAIVMPFMSNGNLHSLLHHTQDGELAPIGLASRLRLIQELARGISYLHHGCNFQIIHCDIKPQNILLDDNMTVKISDFAISCLSGDFDGSVTSSSLAVKGTIGYIAPEYGMGERISVKGDVYSFGVVTLEIMTRLKPTHEMFSGDLTLPWWISMSLQGKSSEERRMMVKEILNTAHEGGRGIEMNCDEQMSVVESILTVGLRCTCQDPWTRPNMNEVESMLESLSVGYSRNHSSLRIVEAQIFPVIQ